MTVIDWPGKRSWHRTRWGARRARRKWMQSVRGRDAYVHHYGPFRWACSRIDYVAPNQDRAEFVITAEMPGRWVPHFLGMLKTMEDYGKVGMSRKVAIYADGDGDFNPRFAWAPAVDPAKPAQDDNGDVFFDAG